MSYFEIQGGYSLHGEIIPQGAKNEALQVLCAVLLSEDKITISNIPNILSPPGLGANAFPNRANNGPIIIIEPRILRASAINSLVFR